MAALCQRLPTADEMIKKMGEVAVEPKYDGVRVQIHFKRGKFVSSFSRNLEKTTDMFPELTEIGKEFAADEVILDSEAIGFDPTNGKFISFQETVTRKRKHGISDAAKSIPVKFFVFDILYKDGKELLSLPLSERRVILRSIITHPHHLVVSPEIVTTDAAQIRSYHDEQIKKGLEGAVVKKWNSPYEPGRKGFSWVKFKEEEGKTGKLTDTIDAVVMGYTSGEGKRTAFGVGQMLLGVKDGDEFVTVTKLGSGATEAELGTLFKALKKLQVNQMPKEYKNVNKVYTPDFWVTPGLVLEIAGDDLTRSPAHGAGYAVRFPRLVRIREDKSPREATTTLEIQKMYQQQGSHPK
jgi:DNA ligase-1